MSFDFSEYFPYEKPRDEQIEAINFALDSALNQNKRFIIIECETGGGKSAIGLTVARYLEKHSPPPPGFSPGAYFLTTQKILQDQYENDFGGIAGGRMISLKSSSNYQCSYHPDQNCRESRKALKHEPRDSKFFRTCSFNCKYKRTKDNFLSSPESVTNFPYLLTEATYQGTIAPRNVLVIDEAHNIESELSKFIDMSVSEYFSTKILNLDFPEKITQKSFVTWIKEQYHPQAKKHLNEIKIKMAKLSSDSSTLSIVSLEKQLEIIEGHVRKVDKFLSVYDEENWIINILPGEGNSRQKVEFKVIDVSQYSHQLLFRMGSKVLMMSATILDHKNFCEMLGIPIEESSFITIPTPFPKENRPIIE